MAMLDPTSPSSQPLTLTVLGAGPAVPNPGGACSGYLLAQGGTRVLMDCGSGVVGRLRQHMPPSGLDGVVVSHLHPDHYFDLVQLYYFLRYWQPAPAPPLLFVPPGGQAGLRRLSELVTGGPEAFDETFSVREYAARVPHRIGALTFSFHPVQHYVPSYAMRVSPHGGPASPTLPTPPTLVFSSDVAPCAALVDAARGADLFLCESALIERSQDDADPLLRGHLLAAEAGDIARQAGARRLLLTHYPADRAGLVDHHRSEAERAFGRPVELAQEGRSYAVTGGGRAESGARTGEASLSVESRGKE